jgi:hypothetical protein
VVLPAGVDGADCESDVCAVLAAALIPKWAVVSVPTAVNALVKIAVIDVDVVLELPTVTTPAMAIPRMARSPMITA